MIFKRHRLFTIVFIVVIRIVLCKNEEPDINHVNWNVVESLAEKYPYIVGLLDTNKTYICTGIIVNSETVLTSGSCIQPLLHYIAVGSAVLSRLINKNNLFNIAKTSLHSDYTFELKSDEPNVTRMHSNLGLVFSARPELDVYIPGAVPGNYYAPELRAKDLTAIGYGRIGNAGNVALQFQRYHQRPCNNPKWYYCICGYEISNHATYTSTFGEGAPVFLGLDLVGIAATPCGTLELKAAGIKYNIFTVIGPYVPWIEKTCSNMTKTLRFRSTSNANAEFKNHLIVYLLLALLEGCIKKVLEV